MPRPGYGLPFFELTVLQGAGDQLAGIRAYPDRGQSLDGFVAVVETLAFRAFMKGPPEPAEYLQFPVGLRVGTQDEVGGEGDLRSPPGFARS